MNSASLLCLHSERPTFLLMMRIISNMLVISIIIVKRMMIDDQYVGDEYDHDDHDEYDIGHSLGD